MSGRRSHARFAVLQSPTGTLRVLRDIVIQSSTGDHIVAVSREVGVLGEVVSVQFPSATSEIVRARVLQSQPVVVDGTVRHQLLLRQVNDDRSEHEVEPTLEGGIALE